MWHKLWKSELLPQCIIFFVIIFSLEAPFSGICQADDIYTFVIKKQEDKEKGRWSLSDWLDTRDRMRIQDLWLAMHTSSPYEFNLEGNYQFDQLMSGPSFNAWQVGVTAFATLFGLEGKYESGLVQRWFGIFDVRIFGLYDQSTNITLQVGLRQENGALNSFANPLAGARVTIYLSRAFGIEGLLHHYFTSSLTSAGSTYTGDRAQGGAFLDFKFLRVYGDYFSDSLAAARGVMVGTKFYF